MATGTQNNIAIKLAGTTIYTVRTSRDTADYPLNDTGKVALQTAIQTGTYPNPLIVEDNGATIAARTVPPSVKPAAPALTTPTGFSATPAGQTVINLLWSSVSGATGYALERSADGATGWTQIATPTGTSYTNTGLAAGTQYYYRLRATSSAGNSAYSSVVNATTSNTYAAYTKKMQAEDATSNISYSGTAGDGVCRGFGSTPSDYMQWGITDANVSDGNYSFAIRYQTSDGSVASTISLILNGVAANVTLPPTGGALATVNVTGKTLAAGINTIRIQGVSGNFGIDYITITHPASS